MRREGAITALAHRDKAAPREEQKLKSSPEAPEKHSEAKREPSRLAACSGVSTSEKGTKENA